MLANEKIASIRRDYIAHGLLEKDVLPDAMAQFSVWLHDAVESEAQDPTAMVLSTISENQSTASTANSEKVIPKVSSRVVLLKSVDKHGFIFFTNYLSRKGRELAVHPNASLLFFWHELTRQVRIEGAVEKISRKSSEEYFATRPYDSQLAAWASEQGKIISGRKELHDRFEQLQKEYNGAEVPMPPHWGGYILHPDEIEFWAGRPNRLHDRLLYTREHHEWKIKRLAP